MGLMEAVAEMTKYNFSQIYDMPIVEFLTYTAYLRYKAKKEEEQIRQFNIKNRR